jgi:hypothetical protein
MSMAQGDGQDNVPQASNVDQSMASSGRAAAAAISSNGRTAFRVCGRVQEPQSMPAEHAYHMKDIFDSMFFGVVT